MKPTQEEMLEYLDFWISRQRRLVSTQDSNYQTEPRITQAIRDLIEKVVEWQKRAELILISSGLDSVDVPNFLVEIRDFGKEGL